MRRLGWLGLVLILLLGRAPAHAVPILLGDVRMTGNFTVNTPWRQGDPDPKAYGWFSAMIVTQASGLFAPVVTPGTLLGLADTALYAGYGPPALWTLGGYTVQTQPEDILLTGFCAVGCQVTGPATLSGLGFDPSLYGLGAGVGWTFVAPPVGAYQTDLVTGPITLRLVVKYDDGRPFEFAEPPATLLLGLGLGLFMLWRGCSHAH